MTTTSFSEGNYAAEFLITEGPNQYSREAVTVASGQTTGRARKMLINVRPFAPTLTRARS